MTGTIVEIGMRKKKEIDEKKMTEERNMKKKKVIDQNANAAKKLI